jgi:squalene-hopene/tetraprenyl-beta-curcumene cyclase
MYAISYWSRAVLTPLLILFAHHPAHPAPRGVMLDELVVPGEADPRFAPDPSAFTWRNFFLLADRLLRLYEAFPLRPLRRRALEAAHRGMVERMQGRGGLGAIFPARAHSLLALRCLGYARPPPGGQALREWSPEVDAARPSISPRVSPVWTRPGHQRLLEPPPRPSAGPAARMAAGETVARPGDWEVNTGVEPGGWRPVRKVLPTTTRGPAPSGSATPDEARKPGRGPGPAVAAGPAERRRRLGVLRRDNNRVLQPSLRGPARSGSPPPT